MSQPPDTDSTTAQDGTPKASAAVIVHGVAQARAAARVAARLGCPLTLWSAPEAAAYLGAPYFAELALAAAELAPGHEIETVLDCGGDGGYVLNALRQGISAVAFFGPPETAARLAQIAHRRGARLYDQRPQRALDLRHVADPDAAVAAWLAALQTERIV